MEIKHVVTATSDECMSMFLPIKTVCLSTYGSIDRQEEALRAAYAVFCTTLNSKMNEAFVLGYKVGDANGNAKDSTMYGA